MWIMNKLFCTLNVTLVSNSAVWQRQFLQSVTKNKCLLNFLKGYASKPKLQHIGVLDQCKADANYNIGQTFFHKVFAYRGIILHPWTAHLHERNRDVTNSVKQQDDSNATKKSAPKLETYYQVLVDARDSSQLACHSSEAVTLLLNSSSRTDVKPLPHAIVDVDYVSHEDIIPYTSCEEIPIQHNFFDKFFVNHNKKRIFQTTEMYNNWQKNHHMCLELLNVYRETTEHIRVTVMPFFLGADEPHSRARKPEYWWRYCIRIENLSGINVQLRESYWRTITNGTVSTRRGVGILGRELILNCENPAFQIAVKPFSLPNKSGNIWGTFRFEREDGEQFDVRIPAFSLDSITPLDPDLSSLDNK